MGSIWFALVAVMMAVYVVLDGFDFGVGILHLFVARTDVERQTTLAAIGPVWDGNEVWLLAGGGALVFAFPRVYAAGFSGFYLPLMMALWLLVMRGLSIELRSHEKHWIWRAGWDGMFFLSSILMAIILGAALGNVIRGVPLTSAGYFRGPLFTNFRTGPEPGVLDWYTVLVGLFATVALALHGACYLLVKTDNAVYERTRTAAAILWPTMFVLGVLVTLATNAVCPSLYAHLIDRPWTWLLALLIAVSAASLPVMLRRKNDLMAFLSTTGVLLGLLAATAAGVYPVLLRSTLNPYADLTVANSASGKVGLEIGLVWWSIAIVLAIVYFSMLFRSFRGKVKLGTSVYGH